MGIKINYGVQLISIYFVLFTCFVGFGNAIKCYQCTSVNDTNCADITVNNNSSQEYLKECDGDYHGKQPFCRKTTQTILDEVKVVRIHRSCGWEEDKVNYKPCYKYETDFHLEMVCVCSEDGCNAAPHSTTSAPLLTLVATASTIVWVLFRR